MSKRLIWVSSGFVAVAIVAGVFWLGRWSGASSGFTQLMNRGNGLLEKGNAIAAINQRPGVPPENIVALYDAAYELGFYT